MIDKKEMTARKSSVGADKRQSLNVSVNSLSLIHIYVDYLCQGTIYPDVVESGVGESAVIKSHHNVGGLPEDVDFSGIIEPLRDLFKDEVRKVGIYMNET